MSFVRRLTRIWMIRLIISPLWPARKSVGAGHCGNVKAPKKSKGVNITGHLSTGQTVFWKMCKDRRSLALGDATPFLRDLTVHFSLWAQHYSTQSCQQWH